VTNLKVQRDIHINFNESNFFGKNSNEQINLHGLFKNTADFDVSCNSINEKSKENIFKTNLKKRTNQKVNIFN